MVACRLVFFVFFIPQLMIPRKRNTQAIAGSQDRAGTKPEAGSMEGDGKTRAAPPCRDNNKKGTQKTLHRLRCETYRPRQGARTRQRLG
jgi:hypothetical protein